ncbi:uncharacterized protein LOC122086877 [Macadamia integrifolia]|uniref:uncharacterized protein LOC122086877 n=1 Tax=Macadamia integrifolia TaxID=60698 RepID=UPI001C4F8CA1|nr:uncharacterized protein LOC122086877 [Macadamia integrifolia]
MGSERWKERGRQLLQTPFLRELFYVITLSLLSLILPLSFLLLARLANAHYIISFTSLPSSLPFSSLFPLSLLYTNPSYPNLLHLLVSIISFTALLQALMGHFAFIPHSNSNSTKSTTTPTSQAYLYTAWALLCTFDVCVVLGIEGTIADGFWPLDLDGISIGIGRGSARSINLMIRVVFFIGMHETMLHWSRVTVRPVVDDTVLRVVREERLVERVAMAASFGGLWWWGLRKEVEAMVVILEVKRELLMNVELADVVNCLLYYLTITIALVRLYWGLVWVAKFLCTSLQRNYDQSGDGDDDDSKV